MSRGLCEVLTNPTKSGEEEFLHNPLLAEVSRSETRITAGEARDSLGDPLGQNCVAILSASEPLLLFPSDIYSVPEVFKNPKNAFGRFTYLFYISYYFSALKT